MDEWEKDIKELPYPNYSFMEFLDSLQMQIFKVFYLDFLKLKGGKMSNDVKKLYAVYIVPESNAKGFNAYVWNSQSEAEQHAKQLVLATSKDMIVFEMTPKARFRITGVDREDLTVADKDNIPSKEEIVKPKLLRNKKVKGFTPIVTKKPKVKES